MKCGCENVNERDFASMRCGVEDSMNEHRRVQLAPVDVVETPDEIVVTADVAGAREGDVEVTFGDSVLTIVAKVRSRRPSEAKVLLGEHGAGEFRRAVRVNRPVEAGGAGGVRAELKAGVLSVRLPLKDSVRTRTIAVQSA